jgi:hypothetical protein
MKDEQTDRLRALNLSPESFILLLYHWMNSAELEEFTDYAEQEKEGGGV